MPRLTSRTAKTLAGLLALTTGFAALSGCTSSNNGGGTGGDAAPKAGGELTIAVQDDPVCLDPQQVTLTTALNMGRQLVDSLVDQDPQTGEIIPWLASAYKTNDNLTSFTFTIRDGVTFSDGSALTADVVKKNFDALFALGKTASLASQYLAGYTGSTVSGSDVTVNFSAPNAPFLQGASTITLGILSGSAAALPAEQRCQKPVGSGPFVLDSYTPKDSVVMTKRTGYAWGSSLRKHTGEAYLDKVTFTVSPEPSVRTGGLQTGGFGMIFDLPAADEKRFDTPDYTIFARPNPGIVHSLVPNTTRPIVSEEAVRQAMVLATDRSEIKALTGSSKVKPAASSLSDATAGFTEQAALKTDLDKAKSVLDQAGWKAGSDGIRTKDGKRLTVTVTAFYGKDVLEAAQLELAKAGIDLQIKMVTSGDFFGAVGSGDYDFLGAGLTRTDPDVLRVMFSSAAASKWAIVNDPDLEKMLVAQTGIADQKARMDTIAKIQARITEKSYLVPLLQVAQVHAAKKGVTGLQFDSSSRVHLFDVSVSD